MKPKHRPLAVFFGAAIFGFTFGKVAAPVIGVTAAVFIATVIATAIGSLLGPWMFADK